MEYTYDIKMFKETFEFEFTYINGFLRNVHRFAYKTALCNPQLERSWTYEELNKDVNKLANALLAEGIKKNDVVMYQLLNCAEFVIWLPKKSEPSIVRLIIVCLPERQL